MNSVRTLLSRYFAPSRGDLIVFNHIPKTAGMSLHEAIRRNARPNTVLELYGVDGRDRLAALTQRERQELYAIVGHLPFSYFAYFPVRKSMKHITILREPIDRVVSFYNYILRNPEHYLHQKLVDENISLKEFLKENLSFECDNLQVRYLCSDDKSGVPIGACTRDMLDQAKENLRTFTVVGFVDRFSEAIEACAERFGWGTVAIPQINIAPPKASELDSATRKLLCEMNNLDEELFAFARKRADLLTRL